MNQSEFTEKNLRSQDDARTIRAGIYHIANPSGKPPLDPVQPQIAPPPHLPNWKKSTDAVQFSGGPGDVPLLRLTFSPSAPPSYAEQQRAYPYHERNWRLQHEPAIRAWHKQRNSERRA